MNGAEHVDYDEFGLFHENAEEYGLGGDPTMGGGNADIRPRLAKVQDGGGQDYLEFTYRRRRDDLGHLPDAGHARSRDAGDCR